jgi:hypothetical protein
MERTQKKAASEGKEKSKKPYVKASLRFRTHLRNSGACVRQAAWTGRVLPCRAAPVVNGCDCARNSR